MKFILLILSVLTFPIMVQGGPHTVQKGETFGDIAKLYGIPLDSLLYANPNTEAYTGLTIEVPLNSLVYDLGESNTFRFFQYRHKDNINKGIKEYRKGREKLGKMFTTSGNKRKSLESEVITCFEKAISYGSIDALYHLGRYKVHGCFYSEEKPITFDLRLNENLNELAEGIEYLQIAAISGHIYNALTELAVVCGHQDSPIRNPYLCLSMLEKYKKDFNLPVNDLLCYMYETGYGINIDYIQAYINTPELSLTNNNSTKTHREEIIEKIELLPSNFENSRYGVGLDSNMLFAIGMGYYHDDILEPEGLFWLHRASYKGNADASWTLAEILQNKNYRKGYVNDSNEDEILHFVSEAANSGKPEAKEYLVAYKEYQKQKREAEHQREIEQQLLAEQKKREREQRWINFAYGLAQTAAQTYLTIEANKNQNYFNQSQYYSPSMPLGQMSDAQFFAHNQLALEQIAQYTYNKVYADWTGTPMAYTDMSAVNLGTDMSPGSPLWMWNMQQDINRMATVNAKMQCEIVAFYKKQADDITQHMITNPTSPIAGYVDIDGNWISHDMVANGINYDNDSDADADRYNGFEKIRQRNRDYYSLRYGNKECPSCHNRGICKSCNGTKYIYGDLGQTTPIECPNCFIENGHRTGLCRVCQGSGYVYGLK